LGLYAVLRTAVLKGKLQAPFGFTQDRLSPAFGAFGMTSVYGKGR
jgi:hypothetical protein